MIATSDTLGAVTADGLLDRTPAELDGLFRAAAPGPVPTGRTRGTGIVLPGTPFARAIALLFGLVFWKGKVFRPQTGDLKNLVSPFGVPAIRALVGEGDSWLDGGRCTVIDYARTSRVAGWIRDETREVAPGVHLGLVWGVGRVFGGRRLVARFALTVPAQG